MSKKEKEQRNRKTKVDPPDQEILDSIGNPNVWTPAVENAWMKELQKLPAGEIYCRFPPMKKPSNVALRGKNNGWGDNV